jgi:hypothetical protein
MPVEMVLSLRESLMEVGGGRRSQRRVRAVLGGDGVRSGGAGVGWAEVAGSVRGAVGVDRDGVEVSDGDLGAGEGGRED